MPGKPAPLSAEIEHMITEKQLEALIIEYFGGSDKYPTEVMIKSGNRIMVFIDGDRGVLIEDCQKLSRHIEQSLDREKEDFDLMVSSAGADRSLVLPRQYRRYLGKNLDVATVNGLRAEGKVLEAGDEGIKLEQEIKKSKKETEKKVLELKYGEIKSAKAVLSFKHNE